MAEHRRIAFAADSNFALTYKLNPPGGPITSGITEWWHVYGIRWECDSPMTGGEVLRVYQGDVAGGNDAIGARLWTVPRDERQSGAGQPFGQAAGLKLSIPPATIVSFDFVTAGVPAGAKVYVEMLVIVTDHPLVSWA